MTLVDTEVAAYVLQCSVRQVQTLVAEGQLADHSILWPTGRRRKLRVDLDEVYERISRKRGNAQDR